MLMADHKPSFATLIDNMNTAVLVFDNQFLLQFMNSAAENLLNTSLHRCHKQAVNHIFIEDHGIAEGLIKASTNQQLFTKRHTQLFLPTLETVTVDYTVTPTQENQQPLLLMEIQAIDRALKISKEEMLVSSQEISKQLIRGLAHEIKNPLGGLRGAAQLLERELPSPELKDYTHIIIKEADRLRNLVDQMLGPNHLTTTSNINIHEILEHIRKLLKAETHNRLTIHFDYDPSLPEISGDKAQLIQAMLNIARNGVEAMLEHGTENPSLLFKTRIQRNITIGRESLRLALRVDIEDNGPGIKEELRENLFFPMVTGRDHGTGLGLSIAQTIIGQHKAMVQFESEPGKTTFSIYFPLNTKGDSHAQS